ncbi:winged helix-turn-helix transcriptional regulator [candidate division KSB1 bacterium]|nr:winged helix-turn-helix transcriptional regulator [candidate division KSB1 bacterium]
MASIDYNRNAQIFKALAHPTRIHLIELILEKRQCVKMMEETLGLTQPNISQHLSLLRNLGIVHAERDGNQVCYHVSNERITKLIDLISD